MNNFILEFYPQIKALHVVAIISWMAGLLYLPRLFVYHEKNISKSEAVEIFKVMEKKLLFFITIPAMIISILTGDLIAGYIYHWQGLWLHLKLSFVFLLVLYTIFLYRSYNKFCKGENKISATAWKFLNEVPTIIMIIIVFLVIIKP